MIWLMTSTGYVNLGLVVRIEESDNGSTVVLLNGDKVEVDLSVDELAEQTGTIIEPQWDGSSSYVHDQRKAKAAHSGVGAE